MVRGRMAAVAGVAAATMVIWQARRSVRPGGEPAPADRVPSDTAPAVAAYQPSSTAAYRELEPGRHRPRRQQALELQAEARATALFNEAVALGRDQSPESPEIAAMVCAEVVRRFGDDPALRHVTATARFNRAQVLGGLRRDVEAAAAFAELAEVAGEDPGLREMTAKARYSQAVMLRRRRTGEAQAAIRQAVSLYRELVAADRARYRHGLDRAEEIAARLGGTGRGRLVTAGRASCRCWPRGAGR